MGKPFMEYVTFGTPTTPFRLIAGGELSSVTIAMETWGELSPRRDNLILLTTGLSASTHAASHGDGDPPGWWEQMVGPGRPIDTQRWFVVCTNSLGGCFGSTGPASKDPATEQPYARSFPVLNVEDMVEAQAKVLESFDVTSAQVVIGASLGGMQALQWAAQRPENVGAVIPIAAPARSYAFSIAWRAVQRQVVMSDPAWQNGRYAPGQGPVQGLNLARSIGILSYRSPAGFDPRFGREFDRTNLFDPDGAFEMEKYLAHNAAKFGAQFDANSYLLLARTMDLFDLGRGAASFEAGVARITAPSLIVGFSSDLLFPAWQQAEIHEILTSHGRPSRYTNLETVHGHDAFLIEIHRLGPLIASFLDEIQPSLGARG